MLGFHQRPHHNEVLFHGLLYIANLRHSCIEPLDCCIKLQVLYYTVIESSISESKKPRDSLAHHLTGAALVDSSGLKSTLYEASLKLLEIWQRVHESLPAPTSRPWEVASRQATNFSVQRALICVINRDRVDLYDRTLMRSLSIMVRYLTELRRCLFLFLKFCTIVHFGLPEMLIKRMINRFTK